MTCLFEELTRLLDKQEALKLQSELIELLPLDIAVDLEPSNKAFKIVCSCPHNDKSLVFSSSKEISKLKIGLSIAPIRTRNFIIAMLLKPAFFKEGFKQTIGGFFLELDDSQRNSNWGASYPPKLNITGVAPALKFMNNVHASVKDYNENAAAVELFVRNTWNQLVAIAYIFSCSGFSEAMTWIKTVDQSGSSGVEKNAITRNFGK